MHLQRHRHEKRDDRRESLSRFHAGENAEPAADEHRAGRLNGLLRRRHALGAGVLSHALRVLQVIDAVVEEEAAEDGPPDHMQRAHNPSMASRCTERAFTRAVP